MVCSELGRAKALIESEGSPSLFLQGQGYVIPRFWASACNTFSNLCKRILSPQSLPWESLQTFWSLTSWAQLALLMPD